MKKPRVLLAWEYGRNFGHIASLRAAATHYEQAGYEVAWALPVQYLEQRRNLGVHGEIFAAPTLSRQKIHGRRMAVSFADILLRLGFSNTDSLFDAVCKWREIHNAASPDILVLDYAPIAQLASYLFNWRAIQLSNGFDAPPAICPPFGFGSQVAGVGESNALVIDVLNKNIVTVANRLVANNKNFSFANFLMHPKRLVTRIPEADPCGARADVEYIGPIGEPPEVHPVEWPRTNSKARRVFAYLRKSALRWPVLKALEQIGAEVLCVCPDMDEKELHELPRTHSLRIVNRPVEIKTVLQQADAIVSYGATTLVCQTLLAGKPQLILPTDLEKWLVSRRVQNTGAGVVVNKPDEIERAIQLLFRDETLLAAQTIAARYAGVNWVQKFKNVLIN